MPSCNWIWKEIDFILNKSQIEREAEVQTLQYLLYVFPNMFIDGEELFGEFTYSEDYNRFESWGIGKIKYIYADRLVMIDTRSKKVSESPSVLFNLGG